MTDLGSTSQWADRRRDFAALGQTVHGRPLVYLDSAATALKPQCVVDVLTEFNRHEAANVHRGAHYLSDRATEKFERTRELVRAFLNAAETREIIFTAGTTDSINLVAQTYARQNLHADDEIILTEMEHHSNIVPWQILEQEIGVKLKWVKVDDRGEIDQADYQRQLTEKVKIVALVHASNALGTVNPIKAMIAQAHAVGAKVLIDAAQSATFLPLDVRDLDCDFLAFSGHKLYGPFGVGILYGRHALLESTRPARGGGATISKVTKNGTTFLGSPQKFEAGTPNISGVIGLGAAIEYLGDIGLQTIRDHEQTLLKTLDQKLSSFGEVQFLGRSSTRVNVVSFNLEGLHASDVGQILDQQGVAVRSGHHCTQPLMTRFGVPSTLRASFGIYNNSEDIEVFMTALKKAREMLK